MPFVTSKLYDFRGQRLSLREISQLTGIKRDTLSKRADRGIAFDAPIRWQTRKKWEAKPQLRGEWQSDVEMIVRWMHDKFLRSREANTLRGLR